MLNRVHHDGILRSEPVPEFGVVSQFQSWERFTCTCLTARLTKDARCSHLLIVPLRPSRSWRLVFYFSKGLLKLKHYRIWMMGKSRCDWEFSMFSRRERRWQQKIDRGWEWARTPVIGREAAYFCRTTFTSMPATEFITSSEL